MTEDELKEVTARKYKAENLLSQIKSAKAKLRMAKEYEEISVRLGGNYIAMDSADIDQVRSVMINALERQLSDLKHQFEET